MSHLVGARKVGGSRKGGREAEGALEHRTQNNGNVSIKLLRNERFHGKNKKNQSHYANSFEKSDASCNLSTNFFITSALLIMTWTVV